MRDTRAPALIISVDTEADDQWSIAGRQRLEVRNVHCLPRLQAQVDGHLPPLTRGVLLVAAGLGDRVGDYAALALLD